MVKHHVTAATNKLDLDPSCFYHFDAALTPPLIHAREDGELLQGAHPVLRGPSGGILFPAIYAWVCRRGEAGQAAALVGVSGNMGERERRADPIEGSVADLWARANTRQDEWTLGPVHLGPYRDQIWSKDWSPRTNRFICIRPLVGSSLFGYPFRYECS
jgi:hypothetical protein